MNALSDQTQNQNGNKPRKFMKSHRRTKSSPNSNLYDNNQSLRIKGSAFDSQDEINPLSPSSFNRAHSAVSSNSPRSIGVGQSPRISQHLISSPSIGNLNQDAIDSLEKEQEGVVMKLLREIKMLQEENAVLKQKLNAGQSSPLSSNSNCTSPRPSISSSHSSYGNNNSTLITKRRSTVTDASIRRVPTSISHHSRSRSGSFSFSNVLSPTSSLGILVPPFGGLSVTGAGGVGSEEINGNGISYNVNNNSNSYPLEVNNNDIQTLSHKRRSSIYSTGSNSSSRREHHLFGNYTIRKKEKEGLNLNCRGSQDESSIDGDAYDADDAEDSYVAATKNDI